MNEDLLDLLADPETRDSLKVDRPQIEHSRIKSGFLISKYASHPIIDFIPQFVLNPDYAKSFGYEWIQFNKTQLDSYTGTNISQNRWMEITGKKPEEMTDKVVLDAGCGAGRFLEVVAPYAKKVIGLDMSAAIESSRNNLMHRFPSIDFIHGDLSKPPFLANSIDFIYCIGVLHHIPDILRGVKALFSCLKPGCELAVWVYGPRALSPLPLPIDLYRYIGSRVNPTITLTILRKYVPFALRTHRIPIVGKFCKYVLFWAADYPNLPIPDHLRLEWSILDTFDTIATKIEKHFKESEMMDILMKAGFRKIKKGRVYNSFICEKEKS